MCNFLSDLSTWVISNFVHLFVHSFLFIYSVATFYVVDDFVVVLFIHFIGGVSVAVKRYRYSCFFLICCAWSNCLFLSLFSYLCFYSVNVLCFRFCFWFIRCEWVFFLVYLFLYFNFSAVYMFVCCCWFIFLYWVWLVYKYFFLLDSFFCCCFCWDMMLLLSLLSPLWLLFLFSYFSVRLFRFFLCCRSVMIFLVYVLSPLWLVFLFYISHILSIQCCSAVRFYSVYGLFWVIFTIPYFKTFIFHWFLIFL